MKKIVASLVILTSVAYSAEPTTTQQVIEAVDAHILQPVGDYLQNQAATDLNKGAVWIEEEAVPFVKEEVIPFVEEKVIEPVEHYITEQAPKDYKKIEKRTKKNVKNESKKALRKIKF
jgi:hypothetical protein